MLPHLNLPKSHQVRVLFLLDLHPTDSTMRQLEAITLSTKSREGETREAGSLFPEDDCRETRGKAWRLLPKQDQDGEGETKEPYKKPKPVSAP